MIQPTHPAAEPWLLRPLPQDNPPARLFVFHHAGGGGASYVSWARALRDVAEVLPVQLPGRENRRREAPYRSLPRVVSDLADELRPYLDAPFAFFGHSMGSFIGFEVARILRDRYGLPPAHLFVSGFRAPHLPDSDPPIYELPDAEFVDALRHRYDGIPAAILQDPEILALFLPVLRADLELVETYGYQSGEPLTCPILALGGDVDRRLDDDRLRSWGEHTSGGFDYRFFPGGHFYLQQQATAVQRLVAARIASI